MYISVMDISKISPHYIYHIKPIFMNRVYTFVITEEE